MKNCKKLALGLAIFFNLFLLLFALDIFSEGYGPVELILGLFMHLIPNIVLVFATFLAYKKELMGGISFILLGIISSIFFKTYVDPLVFTLISGPLFIVGGILLFPFISQKRK